MNKIEVRYARLDEYSRVARFLDQYWAKDHIYVREPDLFEWTFHRRSMWDDVDHYSFAIAEDGDEMVGILGGIPFELNVLGRPARAAWLANFMIRPEYRRGTTAIRLLGMFRRPPQSAVIAFRVSTEALPLYRSLRWTVVEDIPRHFLVLPGASRRMETLLRHAYTDWPIERAAALAQAFEMRDVRSASEQPCRHLPCDWNESAWATLASKTVGAARTADYLRWRYLDHPSFDYRLLVLPGPGTPSLCIWRLESIRVAGADGLHEIDRIGRIVEFAPSNRASAAQLLAALLDELRAEDAFAADFYGYHGEIGAWLDGLSFRRTESHADGAAVPSRFQPLDPRGGTISSAMALEKGIPTCLHDASCSWYWTKSDGDQDRPN